MGARLGPLESGEEGAWEAGQVECAEGGRLWCPACVSGGVQGLLLAEPAPSQLLTTQAARPLGTHPGPGPPWMGHGWSLEGALGSQGRGGGKWGAGGSDQGTSSCSQAPSLGLWSWNTAEAAPPSGGTAGSPGCGGGTRPPEAQGVPSRGAAMTCQPGVRGP